MPRAGAIAGRLAAHGAGPERVVALALPRTADMIAAILGAHKAGAAYLPVDPDYPADRVAFMLADAAPACVVTTSGVAAGLPPGDTPVVILDGLTAQSGPAAAASCPRCTSARRRTPPAMTPNGSSCT